MKRLFSTLFLLLPILLAHAQINHFFDYRIGDETQLDQFNAKGKLHSRMVEKVLRCDTTNEGLIYVLNVKTYTPKGEKLTDGQAKVINANGVILIDMKSIYSMKDNLAYTWDINSEYLSIPSVMSDGQTLRDASVTCTATKAPRINVGPAGSVNSKSDLGARVTYSITNRIVKAERIKIPLGEFECFKVTSEIINESEVGYGYKVTMVTNEWYAEGFGLLKSEVLNERGKLVSYSILSNKSRLP
jgi:hypothetical protein